MAEKKFSKSSDSRTWNTVNPNASLPTVDEVVPTSTNPLPDASGLNVPDSGVGQGVSTSTPFSTREDYENRLTTEKDSLQASLDRIAAAKRQNINEEFAPKIKEAEQYREDITRSTKGALGTDRRLSTAALTFVDERRGNAQKQVNHLESQRTIALNNLDTEMAEKLDKQISEWKTNEMYWMTHEEKIKQQDFENNFREKDYNRLVDKDQREEDRQVKQDAKDNFNQLIDLGYDFTKLSDEDKSSFADTFGVSTEASQSIFDSMKEAQEAAKVGDEVAKMKGVYDLLTMIPIGEEITIGGETYTGTKSNNEDMLSYEKIVGGKKYLIGYNKKTGKEEYKLDMGLAYKPTEGKVISLSEAITLGDPTLAGKPYSAIPEGIDVPDPNEQKDIESFEDEAAKFRGDLGADIISWGYAFEYLKNKYQAPDDVIDSILEKDNNYTKTGGSDKGGRDQQMLKVGS